MLELYDRNLSIHGPRKAARLFVLGVLGSFRIYRTKKLKGLTLNFMLTNHFKVAFRHSLRHKVFSSVNLLSLFLGISATLFIGLYLLNETGYDRFHKNNDSLYRVLRTDLTNLSSTASLSSQYGKLLSAEFPGVTTCSMGNDPVKIGEDNPVLVEDFYWTDPTFFKLFSFPLIAGDPAMALSDPSGLVLTEQLSRKLFGGKNPLGEVVKVKIYDGNEVLTMKVTGIVANPPSHSHIQFSALGAMSIAEDLYASLASHWGFSWVRTYALIPNLENSGVREGIPGAIEKFMNPELAARLGVDFQPMRDVYLRSQHIGGNMQAGSIDNVIIFSIIGLFTLLIAVLNYVNLSTARALSRAREIGLRKTIGASRSDLLTQLLVEAVFYTLAAGLLASAVILPALPLLNSWLDLKLTLAIVGWAEISWLLASLLAVGILAGGYPALLLTRFEPSSAIAHHTSGKVSALPRKVLIVVQYFVTTFLITGSIVIYLQFQFMKNFDLGFRKEQLINIPVDDRDLQARIHVLKETIKNIPGVENVATSGEPLPARMQNTWGFDWTGAPHGEERGIDIVGVDQDYFDVVGLEMLEGSTFSSPFEADSARSVVVNEKALALMGKTSAVNETVTIGGRSRKIIGVVKDHHYVSLHEPIAPVAYMVYGPGFRVSPDNVLLRVNTAEVAGVLQRLEATWQQFSTDPFVMSFVDDAFARTYAAEQQFLRVVSAFTFIGIFIALCGVFGLITFFAESRQREISIRKVLGASTGQLTALLSSDFALLFVVAIVAVGPVVYYFAEQWLDNYTFHISFGWQVVGLSAACCAVISAIVLVWQAIRITGINPARALKSE